MKVAAVVLAAGSGTRFGGDKARAALAGRPLWRWSFDALRAHPRVDLVGLVVPGPAVAEYREEAPEAAFVVAGGQDRTASVRIGLANTPDDCDVVLLHDAARPFPSEATIDRVIDAALRSGAAAPGLPVTDTVKRVAEDGVRTVDRDGLWTVQTPQGFRRELLVLAYESLRGSATDDLAAAEAIGCVPEIVPGNPDNLKITHPADLELARRLAASGPGIRTGLGYDIHRFSSDPDRCLVLGGVRFEGSPGLDGHSDADALMHAVTDALLGAASLGDIGVHFPNTDPRWRNAPSEVFLARAGELLKESGWSVWNIDVALVAERPKVVPRSAEIRANLARILGIPEDRVGLKATTNERLGAIGRGEGIACFAVATIGPCHGG
ncbi:MAG: 2-C-methyl-D-erythritol 4-phosphate cytidylyltransferase [Armatimonadetes bacterium]|nr:2-C-methyl-D-erythritol 4-phosphate cytidylyltransferase [Armatimonadota bacterium]MCA1995835.1 2-C-methyl-D-erythritol 4-phosphate cytidylyltransferase [Armatimonadota bacterium]